MSLDIKSITELLQQPLPGWTAWQKMSPVKTDRYREKKETSKRAAVMALLYPDAASNLNLIFIKRPAHPLDKHSGQISFPGGSEETEDKNLKNTALRETYEELGIAIENIQVLGPLSPIYIYVSDFYVEPYVGYMNHEPKYKLQKSEVDYTITMPLSELMLPEIIGTTTITVKGRSLEDVPYYNLNGEVLWGATAMMLSEFLSILKRNPQ